MQGDDGSRVFAAVEQAEGWVTWEAIVRALGMTEQDQIRELVTLELAYALQDLVAHGHLEYEAREAGHFWRVRR